MIIPGSQKAQRGPAPRVITDDIWAKFMSAGLNLMEADQPWFLHQDLPKGHSAKAQRLVNRNLDTPLNCFKPFVKKNLSLQASLL